MKNIKYDVIVLGSGALGLTVAIGSVLSGKKVLLVEKNKSGGECTWNGCIPSKAFISLVNKNYSGDVLERVREIQEEVYLNENPEKLEKMGIVFLKGKGFFVSENQIQVGEDVYQGKKIIIATGTSPSTPKIPGLDTIKYLNNENFFKMKKIPRSITFIGGGVISLELAFPLKKLGVEVTILEVSPTLFSREDEEIGVYYEEKLKKEGIKLYLGVGALKLESSPMGVKISSEEKNLMIESEEIFLSTGRVPNIEDLKLENAKIKYDRNGIIVDKYLRTTSPNVLSGGDVVGPYRFSHMAGYHGEVIVRNLLFPLIKKSVDYTSVPWTVFSNPEFSRTGLTKKETKEKYSEYTIYKLDKSENDRSLSTSEEYFNLEIIVDKNERILGASCIGDRSGEIISTIQFLKSKKIPLYKFADSIQAYPTYGVSLRNLAKKSYINHLTKYLKFFKKN